MLLDSCLSVLSGLSVMLVYYGQMLGRIKLKLGTVVGLGPNHIVLDGRSPEKGKQQPSTFWPIYCGRTAGWITVPLGKEVGLGPGHIVLDRHPAPLPKKGTAAPQFSAHVCGG